MSGVNPARIQLVNDRLLLRQLAAALLLPPAMLVVYLLCAWLTRERLDVEAFCFGWEAERLPLVPWMIVPYLTLDGLLVTGILIARDEIELRRLTRALLVATAAAAIGFILWPMEVAFSRVEPAGVMGRACRVLWEIDPSHNRFPSLHVAVTVILWPVLARRTNSLTRGVVHVWFAMVIASTLLTWQHHVIDVIGGAVVGLGASALVGVGTSSAACSSRARRCFSRRNSSSAPGPKSQSAAVQPKATPVQVPRSQ